MNLSQGLAVPVAMLAASEGRPYASARSDLWDTYAVMRKHAPTPPTVRAEAQLCEDIGASQVRMVISEKTDGGITAATSVRYEHMTVSAVLEGGEPTLLTQLEAFGIALVEDAPDLVFVVPRDVPRKILLDTSWNKRDVRGILRRLPGADDQARHMCAGRRRRGINAPRARLVGGVDHEAAPPSPKEPDSDDSF